MLDVVIVIAFVNILDINGFHEPLPFDESFVIQMSSVNQLLHDFTLTANVTMDGNTNQRLSGKSCAETIYSQDPYWFIDFQKPLPVHGVKIWIRNDSSVERFHNVTINVGLEMSDSIPHLIQSQLCYWFPDAADEHNTTFEFPCNCKPVNKTCLYGRYVVIQIHDISGPQSILSLCEVQISTDGQLVVDGTTSTSLPSTTHVEEDTSSAPNTRTISTNTIMVTESTKLPTINPTMHGATQTQTPTLRSEIAQTTLLPTQTELYVCTCRCTKNENVDWIEVNKKISDIKYELTLDKKSLTSHARTLVSASDDRISSKTVGGFACAVLCTAVGLVILCDLTNIDRKFQRTKEHTLPKV